MAGRALYALVVVIAVGIVAGSAAAGGPNKSEEAQAGPLTVSSIKSVFDPGLRATTYSTDVGDLSGKTTHFIWSLELELVDPAGSSPPGNPNSHAAVDGECNNSKLPGGDVSPFGAESITWKKIGDTFTWYHGDKGDYAPSTYGCDHTKMGPSGHQGVVTLTVTSSNEKWSCQASIAGTNLSADPIYSAKPTCLNLVREHLVNVVALVKEDVAGETQALDLVNSSSAQATDKLAGLSHRLGYAASTLEGSSGAEDAIADLRQASTLDREASREDVLTNDGAKKAKADLEAAAALKQKALAAIGKLIDAQPTH